jgi:hypothetical protein
VGISSKFFENEAKIGDYACTKPLQSLRS